jgi:hypothetical protein
MAAGGFSASRFSTQKLAEHSTSMTCAYSGRQMESTELIRKAKAEGGVPPLHRNLQNN